MRKWMVSVVAGALVLAGTAMGQSAGTSASVVRGDRWGVLSVATTWNTGGVCLPGTLRTVARVDGVYVAGGTVRDMQICQSVAVRYRYRLAWQVRRGRIIRVVVTFVPDDSRMPIVRARGAVRR
jgi:hypothetical protein